MFRENNNKSITEHEIHRDIKDTVLHCKSIIDNLLYDTETSELLCKSNGKAYFKTKNGRYFSCDVSVSTESYYYSTCDFVFETTYIYSNTEPTSADYIKSVLGRFDVEKYIELFGEPEEA